MNYRAVPIVNITGGLVMDSRDHDSRDHGSGRPHDAADSRNGRDTSAAAAGPPSDSGSDRACVADAIALLSADHRAVVLRSYYQRATTAQVAADLRIPEDTVKSRLHFALWQLRQSLQAMGLAR